MSVTYPTRMRQKRRLKPSKLGRGRSRRKAPTGMTHVRVIRSPYRFR